ncbi:uncharacterized protein LOC113359515 [Papaver somniferum]|uniref:uncharacterized protein LOC113359515 n=1 Tax=Papaver somniferum TaxID=3469 RepID=UPI000E702D8E|nr:uncharacterized protein LOC113359515 [Papaver somniferum]
MMDVDEDHENPKDLLTDRNLNRWEILVDGSSNGEGNGIGIVFISPTGARMTYSFILDFASTNNETKYEVVVHALKLAIKIKIEDARITSDSQLVILQIEEKGETTQTYVMTIENMEEENASEDKDWRTEIHLYLEKGEVPRKRLEAHKLKSRATNYELRDGILYRRSFLGPSLRCITRKEGINFLMALHYGDAGNHSGGRSLSYRAKIQGYYWPYMHEDVKQVSRRCEECQRHGKKIHTPGAMLNSSTNAWTFGKWGIDIVGPFIPGTGFGIPAQLVSDNGKQFEGENIKMLLNVFKIQRGKYTPLYPQSNGQVEATNKTIADNLKKKLEGHNKGCCEQVHNVVWAYRTTKREATGMSPFCLTYGVEAVLPTEVIIPTTKKEAWEKNLSPNLILAKLDDLEEVREVALQHMENYQQRLAREYNKRVKIREFQPGELVLREIQIYQRGGDGKLEKKWDGPYIIKMIVGNGAYELMDPEGRDMGRRLDLPWNRQYLKKYYP